MGHKSPSDWVSGFQTGFWRFPRLRNRRKLNCKITDGGSHAPLGFGVLDGIVELIVILCDPPELVMFVVIILNGNYGKRNRFGSAMY